MSLPDVSLQAFEPRRHSETLREWLHRPHVSRWWGDPEDLWENERQRSPETCAVIAVGEIAVGYVCWQRLPRADLDAVGLGDLPEGLLDIDILIGEPEYLGQGIGPRALALLLDRFRADPAVAVAGLGTSASNTRAIRAFEKAGFQFFREFQDPESGASRYMTAEVTAPTAGS